jgi:hypothetical protein
VQATIPITLGADTITQQVRMEIDTALGRAAASLRFADTGQAQPHRLPRRTIRRPHRLMAQPVHIFS